MFGTDYPQIEGTYPHTLKVLHELLDGVDADVSHRIRIGAFLELFPRVGLPRGVMTSPGRIVKVIELVGSSEHSFSGAVRNAVRPASQTIRNITGVEVLSSTADVNTAGELIA